MNSIQGIANEILKKKTPKPNPRILDFDGSQALDH